MAAFPPLHLQKLSVGSGSVEDLAAWWVEQAALRAAAGLDPRPRHVTRAWPKRATELLAGGSIYWVIRGLVLARQQIVAFEPEDEGDGVIRCAIVLDRDLIRTEAAPRRPFQGWRYLEAAAAPRDLPRAAPAGTPAPVGGLAEDEAPWIAGVETSGNDRPRGHAAEGDRPRGHAAEGELPPHLQMALAELGVVRRRA